ncbi:MAG: hypothetical protein DI637_11095 [Citromicrobium sp.]|nr:MAG: hypothetical protein DI637_11095 [Citromicrobium sp.]
MELADLMEVGDVPAEEEFDALTRAIFKAAVEKNDWLYPYEGQSQAARNRLPEMRSAMRENAKFLADYDIEIDYLPE